VSTRSSFSDIASTLHRWLLMHEGGVTSETVSMEWNVCGEFPNLRSVVYDSHVTPLSDPKIMRLQKED
jgi:hypothetical protein